jgi:hypothetical protein
MSGEHPPKKTKVEMGKTEDLSPEELEAYKLTAELEYALRQGKSEPNLEDETRTIEDIDKIEKDLEEITNKEKEQRHKQKEEAKQKAKIDEGKKDWVDRRGWRGPVGRVGKLFSKAILGIFTFFTSLWTLAKEKGGAKDPIDYVSGDSGGGGGHKKADHGHGGGGGHGGGHH